MLWHVQGKGNKKEFDSTYLCIEYMAVNLANVIHMHMLPQNFITSKTIIKEGMRFHNVPFENEISPLGHLLKEIPRMLFRS